MKDRIPQPHVPVGNAVGGRPCLLNGGFFGERVDPHHAEAFLEQAIHWRRGQLGECAVGRAALRRFGKDIYVQAALCPLQGFILGLSISQYKAILSSAECDGVVVRAVDDRLVGAGVVRWSKAFGVER